MLSVRGYYKRNKSKNKAKTKTKTLVLVNLEPYSKVKLEKIKKVYSNHENTPILGNGLNVKYDMRTLSYDVDGVPAFIDDLIGQFVEVKLKVKKYKFKDKYGEFISGWTVYCCIMKPAV